MISRKDAKTQSSLFYALARNNLIKNLSAPLRETHLFLFSLIFR
jgi:hypothetical protein